MDELQSYAERKGFCGNGLWRIGKSSLGGRGLFATKDIPEDTEILQESPLLIGPRSDPRCPSVCVGCSRMSSLRPCSKGCNLSVCSEECEMSPAHGECNILSKLGEISTRVRLALIAPIRSLFLPLNDREVLLCLEKHQKPEHEMLLKDLKVVLNEEDISLVRSCCQVIDATAFEAPTGGGGSVRGVYPIACMTNHSCTPNTRSSFNTAGKMIVYASHPVAADQELTTTYTCLTWGTQARRAHLLATKQFVCRCSRCMDPFEFGARLMGLYCMKKNCSGVLLPTTDNYNKDPWKCTICQTSVPAMRISVIQKMIESTISKVKSDDPVNAYRILCKNSLVPSCNHYAVEFKFSLIRHFGHLIRWQELTEEELSLKQLVCNQLILLLEVLNLGKCTQREFLQEELSQTIQELQKRKSITSNSIFINKR